MPFWSPTVPLIGCLFLFSFAVCCAGENEPRDPKIAFLFLSRGPMPLEELWSEFFNWKADPKEYSIYVHTSAGYEYPTDSIFYQKNQNLAAAVEWGKMSQVRAIKRLVREALKDPLNERFCLMSESCIPLVSFQRWKSVMFNHDKSIINACPMEGMEEYRWHSGLDSTEIKVKDWRKSATWFTLNRKHALVFVNETETESHWEKVMCVDEHYLPTILAWKGLENETTCSDGFAYVHWPSAIASHPTTFSGSDINRSFLKALERPIDIHYTNSQFSQTCSGYEELCHFTARKFGASSKIALLMHLKYLLGDEEHPYENYPWRKYVHKFRRTLGDDGEHVYIVDNGQIRQLPDNTTVHALLHMVRFHDSGLKEIPLLTEEDKIHNRMAPPYPSRKDGTLFKVNRNREIWYMKSGHRHSIPNMDTFYALNCTIGNIWTIDQADMDLIPIGPAIPHMDH